MSLVSLVNGTNRRGMVYNALVPFREEIEQGIQGKQIILKPNVVQGSCPLAVTHVDTLRGLLDFLSPLTERTILIGESSCTPPTVIGDVKGEKILDLTNDTLDNFEYYGYPALKSEYNVDLIDFNRGPSTTKDWIADFNRPGKKSAHKHCRSLS